MQDRATALFAEKLFLMFDEPNPDRTAIGKLKLRSIVPAALSINKPILS